MASNNAEKVYFAPKSQIFLAGVSEAESKLPADLTSVIDPVFKSLGYVNEDGIGCTPNKEFEPVTAAQSASPIKYVLNSAALTLKFVLLQTDPETVELYFGDKWVTTGGVSKLDLKSSPTLAEHALVIEYGDWTQTGGATPTITGNKNRLVVPRGMVSAVDEFKINRTETTALGVTFDAMDKGGSLGYLLSNAA